MTYGYARDRPRAKASGRECASFALPVPGKCPGLVLLVRRAFGSRASCSPRSSASSKISSRRTDELMQRMAACIETALEIIDADLDADGVRGEWTKTPKN